MVSCFQQPIINLIVNALCLEENHIYPNIYCHLDYVSFDVVLSLFFEDEGMLHLSNLNNSDRWICAEILFEWTHDLWDEPIKIWEAFSPVSKLISLFILLVTLCMSDLLRTTDAIWISACIVSRDPQLHMCTCDRLGWNTSRPWFQASLMEGICPEAFHLAHNREPGTHLDCICTVGAWPQRKEIIDPVLPCCRGMAMSTYPVAVANCWYFIYFRRQRVNLYACKH